MHFAFMQVKLSIYRFHIMVSAYSKSIVLIITYELNARSTNYEIRSLIF